MGDTLDKRAKLDIFQETGRQNRNIFHFYPYSIGTKQNKTKLNSDKTKAKQTKAK